MSSGGSVTSSRGACCENGRPIMTDPHTGQTICSCQYGTALLNYSRVQGLQEGVYGPSAAAAAAYAASAAQGYVPLGPEGSAFYSPLNPSAAFDLKEGSETWRALASQGGCFPYDPSLTLYPYGAGYGGLDLNSRRKNATRETTNTLKAWLYEHRKNPYPTKGEKIMLAIITKMTLTQVSTWFANARRRLKKENKMTWSPRNRSEDDVSGDEEMDPKLTGSESDSSHNNAASDDTRERRHSSDREVFERIISVDDDDDSDRSELGDGDDLDRTSEKLLNLSRDSESERLHDYKNSNERDGLVSKSPRETNVEAVDENAINNNVNKEKNDAVANGPTRPKIWSVMDVLGNKDSSSSTKSSTPQNSSPAIVCSRQINGPAFLNAHHNSQNFRVGQYPMGLNGYPFSFSHATLSYPYTLTTATAAAKSDLSHMAALRADAQAFKEGLVEKATRLQPGIFSPARELDGLRVRSKIVL
ncbi:homeobox protein caupolican-like [Dreissena polymorpha]|uniref:Homeobox domain-containing protein n=1 Tax=Dreissena polymorpha TaxID=45954 RepID=A0A9D4LB42_DREPO|nr:homeobox protein caupolican-like [Dreissena polymorpha]KAH3855218.1 hypothetical protein DPMN_097782 [Dreissena polymorpha]